MITTVLRLDGDGERILVLGIARGQDEENGAQDCAQAPSATGSGVLLGMRAFGICDWIPGWPARVDKVR